MTDGYLHVIDIKTIKMTEEIIFFAVDFDMMLGG